MTRSSGMCGTQYWVRERKLLFLLCSFFRSFTELRLLCLSRWAGSHWSKTRGWEGDGKGMGSVPAKGKRPLSSDHAGRSMMWYWRATYPVDPSPHTTSLQSWKPTDFSAELKAYSAELKAFFRGKSVHTDSPCHKWQLGHFIVASFSTWRCSSPENCMVTLEKWDTASKISGCLWKAVLKGDQKQ